MGLGMTSPGCPGVWFRGRVICAFCSFTLCIAIGIVISIKSLVGLHKLGGLRRAGVSCFVEGRDVCRGCILHDP